MYWVQNNTCWTTSVIMQEVKWPPFTATGLVYIRKPVPKIQGYILLIALHVIMGYYNVVTQPLSIYMKAN
jgi:hypothetical protein